SNAYGIKVAAQTYFNKTPDSLNIQESAVLVGLLQAITRFNPVLNPENSLRKRNEVITKLYRHGYIKTFEEYDSIIHLPIELDYKVENHNEGLAPYFRSMIKVDLMKWCAENNLDLENSGLKIYTTIDSRMQRYAEEAVREQMKIQQEIFDRHWKGRNPWIDENRQEIKGFLESRIRLTDAYRTLAAKYGKDSDSLKYYLNRSEEHTSELQSRENLVCRVLLERILATLDLTSFPTRRSSDLEQMKIQQEIFDRHWKGRNPWIDENRQEIKGFLESRIRLTDAYRTLAAKYGKDSDSLKYYLN